MNTATAEHTSTAQRPWLSAEELIELTGYQRRNCQRGELESLGIPFRLRTNGSIVVLRKELETEPTHTMHREFKPDLSGL